MIINIWKKIFKKTPVYLLEDVFTPTTSANISYIQRENVEKQLQKALIIPGKQIVIYGHSGSGKTTVLNHVLKENKIKGIVSRCTTHSSIDSIILDAFDELNPFYTEITTRLTKKRINEGLSSKYLGLKSTLSSSMENSFGETKKRVLPPQLTIQRLSEFIWLFY